MKFFRFFIVLIVTMLTFQSMHPHIIIDTPDTIIDLTESELLQMMKNQEPTIIIGYMNHCSHCPKLLEKTKTLMSKYPQVNFYKVNGPEKKFHKKIADQSKFSIPGYPSMIFVKNGKIENVQIGGNEKILEENMKKIVTNTH